MIERRTVWYSYEVDAESEEEAYEAPSYNAKNYELMEEQHEEVIIEDVIDLLFECSNCKSIQSKPCNACPECTGH